MTEIKDWSLRLESHFKELADSRIGSPVFALEHGLTPQELDELQRAVRDGIKQNYPHRDHQLAWVVYASEIGYDYAGDEYWQTFERATPGWRQHGDRYWLRRAFSSFQRKFNGAEPSGSWASHFSIIAWPITHAILPRDLQFQLARVLYYIRNQFSSEVFEEPEKLGDLIAGRCWDTTSRFQNFIQAPALVGQIAAALLLQGTEGFKTLLLPSTLRRIGDDVSLRRDSRFWLKDARISAEKRVNWRAVGPTLAPQSPGIDQAIPSELSKLGIEPRLILRPIQEGKWEASLEIPDLSHIALRFPTTQETLRNSRCVVAGNDRPLARGRCLHGPQRIVLHRWPSEKELILKFERPDKQLDYLLRSECALRPGEPWLFRVASDGIAYEMRTNRIRAGGKYLIIGHSRFESSDFFRTVTILADGVFGVLLDVPSVTTPEFQAELARLGIYTAKAIEVWPAGLASVAWYGDGYGEWLEHETPILAVFTDHKIETLTISMRQDATHLVTLRDIAQHEPIYVELPTLPVGMYKFEIVAESSNDTYEARERTELTMHVREARQWQPSSNAQAPIQFELDPPSPSLESLWEGVVSIGIIGPPERSCASNVRVYSPDQQDPIVEKRLPDIFFPFSKQDWWTYFEKNIRQDQSVQNAYENAHRIDIEFDAQELGKFIIPCERELSPLSWKFTKEENAYVVCLLDQGDRPGNESIHFYSFAAPFSRRILSQKSEYSSDSSGGLFHARIGHNHCGIVVPPMSLDTIGYHPPIQEQTKSIDSMKFLLSLADIWESAKHTGDMIGRVRQRVVLKIITAEIASVVLGGTWRKQEQRFFRDEAGIGALRANVRKILNFHGLYIKDSEIFPLSSLAAMKNETLDDLENRFFKFTEDMLRLDGEENLLALTNFALRIAGAPWSAAKWLHDKEILERQLIRLFDLQPLFICARFFVLAIDNARGSEPKSGEIYAGWRW